MVMADHTDLVQRWHHRINKNSGKKVVYVADISYICDIVFMY